MNPAATPMPMKVWISNEVTPNVEILEHEENVVVSSAPTFQSRVNKAKIMENANIL